MSDERQATSHAELIQQIMDSRVPKNEREWAAGREIERLRGVVASQLESIQNLGAAPHCPTCACGADQPSAVQQLVREVAAISSDADVSNCIEAARDILRAADPTSSTCDTPASPSS